MDDCYCRVQRVDMCDCHCPMETLRLVIHQIDDDLKENRITGGIFASSTGDKLNS